MAGTIHVEIRKLRQFPVSLQTVTLKIHIFNVSMDILVFSSSDIIMDKKITGSDLSQHSGNDLILKRAVCCVCCPLLHSLSQNIFDTPKAV